jgi:serine phosphatase RsbU (regulator of sigma subunit)
MDIALCCFDEKYKRVYYSGAQRPLYLDSDGEITIIPGTKRSIGRSDATFEFEEFESNYISGGCFYMFSDGITSQFGGPKGKKIKGQHFRQLLKSIKKTENKKETIESYIQEWKGDLEQTDDILIIGLEL